MHKETHYEFSLLREHLYSIAPALAHIHQSVYREVNTVQRGCELLLIGRRAKCVVGQRRIVINLAERDAMASPAAFEFSIVVINQDALGIDDVNLSRDLVQVKEEYSTGESIGLLIVLRWTRRRRTRHAMTEIPEELSVGRKFLDAVALAA